MGERICPMTKEGKHTFRNTVWGRSCVKCHRTWMWEERALVPTWKDVND